MRNYFYVLLVVLIIWLFFYIILEFNIINNKRKIVKKVFLEIDKIFQKRINLLAKMVDIVKAYDKNQFDDLGSKLYDYSKSYDDYDYNYRIFINESLENDTKKLLLVSKVYPELTGLPKFIKLEKQLLRYSKVIKKLKIKYNRLLENYNVRKKIFPSGLLCLICKFYDYNYFEN